MPAEAPRTGRFRSARGTRAAGPWRGQAAGPWRGQATVEFALVLPLVALLALAVVQVGFVVRDQVLVVHAAREAARSAAVEPSPDLARRKAADSSGLSANRLSVEVLGRGGPGSQVRARVRYSAPTQVPVVGSLVGDVALSASVTMRVER